METLLKETEAYVTKILNEELDSKFVYHNLAHTQRVVEKVKELSEVSLLNDKEKSLLEIAAWFHDTGFIKTIDGHEKESAQIAEGFLTSKEVTKDDIETIKSLILATEMNHEPKNESEGIIRDADCGHLGSKNYEDYAALLRKEWELTQNKKFKKIEWINENINFLSNHSFETELGSSKWAKRKDKNLAMLLKEQTKSIEDADKLKQKKAELKFKLEKRELPDRGVETMFRVALKNHITLSDIADTKANILLSVNAIIISVALSNLLPKLDNPSNSYLIYPTLIFLVFTVICIVLSVLATRPNVTKGKFTQEDVANKKVNLLFFGNFHQMKLNEFEDAMKSMMEDKEYLYGSLTKDLYFLGLVLNRKYNLLRTTYSVFMVGIVVSFLAFGISFMLSETMM